MHIEKDGLISSFNELENVLMNYSLPDWDSLPDIELYMDQVISLMKKYLEIYGDFTGTFKIITPAMINNYVKLDIIPAPIKKKYSKKHLAYLLVICTLKQTLDIPTIKELMPAGLSDQDVKKTYNSFVKNQQKAYTYVTQNLKSVAEPIFTHESDNPERMNDLIMQISASANIFKILTDRLSRHSQKSEEI